MKRHSVTGNKEEVIASKGSLIIVGGREDKQKDRVILREIARRTGTGKLIVATLASEVSGDLWKDYRDVFTDLGVKHIEHLHFENHEEARHPKYKAMFHNAKTVFFTGGDQLKITTKIGGTDIVDWIQDIYLNGGTIAGTSAGASVMGKIMLMGGENQESHKVGQWMMSPGLGLLPDMIIDQHFAQRGRIGRLLGAVAPNPGLIGVGIDEDTAIIVEKNHLRVIGTNAVYIVDARNVTYTNLSEAAAENTMAMHNVQLHILAEDHVFDLKTHRPRLDQVERVHG